MARFAKFVDIPISKDTNIFLPEKLIGITITNQGNRDITISMGSENAVKLVASGSDVSYGDVNGGSDVMYLTGNLKIESSVDETDKEQWSTETNVVLTYCYDVSNQEQSREEC